MADVKDILSEMVDQITVVSVGNKKPYAISESVYNAITEAEAELNQHYLKVFMDLIGKTYPDITGDSEYYIGQDSLRAELRQQAKKLLGKESDE